MVVACAERFCVFGFGSQPPFRSRSGRGEVCGLRGLPRGLGACPEAASGGGSIGRDGRECVGIEWELTSLMVSFKGVPKESTNS